MSARLRDTLLRGVFFRYFFASLLALLVDLSILSVCLRVLGMDLRWAAAAAFLAGALVAYILSIRWVFSERAYRAMPLVELSSFIGIGLAGLGITQVVLWFGVEELHLVPEFVKLVAAGATFVFNFIARRSLLFVNRSRVIASGEDLA